MCPPFFVGLRARAIAFIQVMQPLRVATKSNKYGGGKAPKQAHLVDVWKKLVNVAERMEINPEFLFNEELFVLDSVSPAITASCAHYRQTKRNSPMVEKLFSPSDATHDLTINILKSYGTPMHESLTVSQGGAVEFLNVERR